MDQCREYETDNGCLASSEFNDHVPVERKSTLLSGIDVARDIFDGLDLPPPTYIITPNESILPQAFDEYMDELQEGYTNVNDIICNNDRSNENEESGIAIKIEEIEMPEGSLQADYYKIVLAKYTAEVEDHNEHEIENQLDVADKSKFLYHVGLQKSKEIKPEATIKIENLVVPDVALQTEIKSGSENGLACKYKLRATDKEKMLFYVGLPKGKEN